MILIFGGTTEGRIAAKVCDVAGRPFLYSTKGAEQHIVANNAEQICGALEVEEMLSVMRSRGVSLVIDAAHPYADVLHRNIAAASTELSIPVVRLERKSDDCDGGAVVRFESVEQVAKYIAQEGLSDILALTGVKSAFGFAPLAVSNDLYLRVMDKEESNSELQRVGFPEEKVLYYNLMVSPDELYDESVAFCRENSIKAIVTKESGVSGGFAAKVELAKELSIPLFVISRPALPEFNRVVYGEFGLRRAVEQLLPQYFELRSGFTTGSAATAATIAALRAIISGYISDSVEIELPNGEPIEIGVDSVSLEEGVATAVVVKDGGDDPDATHGLEIIARVKFDESGADTLDIDGGEGVGRVTMPGIGVPIGEAAINPVPRAMIARNVELELSRLAVSGSVEVLIEVPRGAEVGAKSFNPRLGILGGISILGTSGIVQPFSAEAFLQSIEQQIKIVKALGESSVVINSGAMSEGYVKLYRDDLPSQCYIHYGNLVGATIELASSYSMERVTIGCMIGKAVKLAAGELDTHSKRATIDREFIASLASEAGCSTECIESIATINTARELWSTIPQSDYALFSLIAQRCFETCKSLLPNGTLEFLLISESGAVEASVVG